MKRAALLLTAFGIAAPLTAPTTASAQCDNGAIVCAEVNVSGSIHIGRRRQQTVVVETNTPPPPPQGRVVVVQPAPPPPPPPPPPQPVRETVVVVETTPVYQQQRVVRVRRPFDMRQKFGVHLNVGSMISEDVRMGGAQFGFRLRPSRIFAVELSVGGYGGTDYNGMDRVEVPLMLNGYFFLPRASRFQMYVVGGIGTSFAAVEGYHPGYDRFMSRQFRYIGGEFGIGGEWRIHPHFALNADVRGFLRTRVDDNDDLPEFYDPVNNRESDTSAGAVLNLGGTFYF